MHKLIDLFHIYMYIFMNVDKLKTLQEPQPPKTLFNPSSVNMFVKYM